MRIDTATAHITPASVPATGKKKRESIWSREISFSGGGCGNSFKARFFAEMSLLAGSGMDIRRSLDIIEGGTAKEKEKNLLVRIKSSVTEGGSLSEALASTGRFEAYDTMTLTIGEETGALTEVLDSLAVYYSKKITQRRQITGAMTYPVMVLVTTVISLVFMLNYIVPMFEDVFHRFQGELPPLTKAIISFSEAFTGILWIVVLLVGTISFLAYRNRKKEWYRRMTSSITRKTPVAKDIVILTYKVRFCQMLTLLVSSRVHLVKALEMIRKVIGFFPLEKALDNIITSISSGIQLADAMEQHSFFDRKMIAMTRVGEEVNRLDTIYEQLYRQYSDELDVKIKTMNNLLEPLLIIFVGMMVGVILVSMYLPIFQLGINIGGN